MNYVVTLLGSMLLTCEEHAAGLSIRFEGGGLPGAVPVGEQTEAHNNFPQEGSSQLAMHSRTYPLELQRVLNIHVDGNPCLLVCIA